MRKAHFCRLRTPRCGCNMRLLKCGQIGDNLIVTRLVDLEFRNGWSTYRKISWQSRVSTQAFLSGRIQHVMIYGATVNDMDRTTSSHHDTLPRRDSQSQTLGNTCGLSKNGSWVSFGHKCSFIHHDRLFSKCPISALTEKVETLTYKNAYGQTRSPVENLHSIWFEITLINHPSRGDYSYQVVFHSSVIPYRINRNSFPVRATIHYNIGTYCYVYARTWTHNMMMMMVMVLVKVHELRRRPMTYTMGVIVKLSKKIV